VIESWGDDVPDGKVTDFRRAVQATSEETVALSWIEWPDKATRDAGMKKMLEDPRMDPSTPGNPPMPFDGKRMIFGGFQTRWWKSRLERTCQRGLPTRHHLSPGCGWSAAVGHFVSGSPRA